MITLLSLGGFLKKRKDCLAKLAKKISLRLTAVERGPLSGSSSKFYFVENIITTWQPPSRPRRHRHLYTMVRAILDEDHSISHWTYNVLRGLFIDKVYKRLYLKEQPR